MDHRIMQAILLILAVMLVASFMNVAVAAPTLTTTWQQPLLDERGTAFAVADIDYFELSYVVDVPFSDEKARRVIQIQSDNSPAAQFSHSFVLKELAPRDKPYQVSAAVRTILKGGATSEFSNIVSREFKVSTVPVVPVKPVQVELKISCDKTCEITLVNP